MTLFIWIGTALGLVGGFFHGWQVFHRRLKQGVGILSAVYFAAWTLALWSMFGAYLLAVWCLGAAGMTLARLGRRQRLSP